jgi:uncharacterized protein YjbI with pentapeptide repeats
MLISDTTISLDDVTPNNTYRNVHFTYSSRAINIQDVTFERVTFDQEDFSDSTWSDVIFDHVDLSNTDFASAIFYRTSFNNTQLTGVNFSGLQSEWRDTEINNSLADFINVSGTTFQNVVFNNTRVRDSFFHGIRIKKSLRFVESDLDNSDFAGSKLANLDVSNANFETLLFDPALAAGMTINTYQSALLIQSLGINIH